MRVMMANVAVQVGSVEIERACVMHVPGAREVAAVAVPPATGGPDRLTLFVVPATPPAAAAAQAELHRDCQAAIRSHLNPLFKVHAVLLCEALPRNASNKVVRRVLREQAKQAQHSVAKL